MTENESSDANTPAPAPPPDATPQGSQFPRPTMQEIGRSADYPGMERRDDRSAR